MRHGVVAVLASLACVILAAPLLQGATTAVPPGTAPVLDGTLSEGETWRLSQDFTWQCRTRGFSNYALNERARFLEQDGWLGTIGYLGDPTQFEYQIAWGEGPLTLLFLFAEFTDPLRLLAWPLAAEDAAQYTELVTGTTPAEPCLSVTDWATLEKGE